MHNEDYIASGILELYAAGGLSAAEREEVERHAAASPEIRQALDEACAAMEEYAQLHAVRPRPELKNRILQEISHSEETQRFSPFTGEGTPVHQLSPAEQTDNSPYKWMFAASIVLFLLSGALSLHFYNKWQQAEDKLAIAVASEQLMAQNFQTTTLRLERQEQLLTILQDPAFKQVTLQGVEAHPNARMLVYWNAQQQQVFIDQVALPAPPAGKQYQLWALVDGNPVDAGVIQTADGGTRLQQMKNIVTAQAFAVTLEPAGGSESPTLEQLTVMGNVDS